mgnify:CR=1 FL=1
MGKSIPSEYQKGGWRGTFMRVPEMEPYQSLNLVAIDELRTGDYERYHIRHYVLKDEKDLEFCPQLIFTSANNGHSKSRKRYMALEITSTSQKKNIFNREYSESMKWIKQLPIFGQNVFQGKFFVHKFYMQTVYQCKFNTNYQNVFFCLYPEEFNC